MLEGNRSGMVVAGERVLNTDGVSIWIGADPFEQAGAYRLEGGRLKILNEDFFRVVGGRQLDISEDGYGPLFKQVAATVRQHNPDWAIFAEMDPFGVSAGRRFPKDLPENSVNATHWYDRATLFRKRFNATNHKDLTTGTPETSPVMIRERFTRELAGRKAYAGTFPGGQAPSLVGEFGIPYDLSDGEAFERWGKGERGDEIWSSHVEALSLMYDALDALQLHSTQWNYTASNRNDLRVGDGWNQEDLSIFSRDQQLDPSDPSSGGRAIRGFCRPYAQRIQGRLTEVRFDQSSGWFDCWLELDPAIDAPTIIYVPRAQYPSGYAIELDPPSTVRLQRDEEAQLLSLQGDHAGPLHILIRPLAQK